MKKSVDNRAKKISGLYAVTPPSDDDDSVLRWCGQCCIGGARVLQYRRDQPAIKTAQKIAELCRRRRVIFIINNLPPLAKKIRADGVHLGKNDMSVKAARKYLGDDFIIGASCGNDLAAVQQALRAGADYVAAGAMFYSATKPAAARCPLSFIGEVKSFCDLPLVAIGGITADNAESVIAAGADSVAVCEGLFRADKVAKTAAAFCELFRKK